MELTIWGKQGKEKGIRCECKVRKGDCVEYQDTERESGTWNGVISVTRVCKGIWWEFGKQREGKGIGLETKVNKVNERDEAKHRKEKVIFSYPRHVCPCDLLKFRSLSPTGCLQLPRCGHNGSDDHIVTS